ncbi:hypothetical protein ACSSUQ_004243 [Yersinia enterocolitica]
MEKQNNENNKSKEERDPYLDSLMVDPVTKLIIYKTKWEEMKKFNRRK